MRQHGIVVAPKSADNFQLGNHFLEAVGSMEMKERLGSTSRWQTRVPDAGWVTMEYITRRGERGGNLTIKVHRAQYCQNERCSLPSKQYYINQACIHFRRYSMWERGSLAHIHIVGQETPLGAVKGSKERFQLPNRGAGVPFNILALKQQRSIKPIFKCTFLIFYIMLLFNKLFTPCLSDEASRGL